MVRIIATLVLTVSVSIAAGDSSDTTWPDKVEEVLELAGDNRPELEQALTHFRESGDSLKYEAALFLIGNMGNHSYVTYYLHDTVGTEIPFDVLAYPNYDTLVAASDSLEKTYGYLDFGRRDPIYDYSAVTADFLITQIDYAFRAWREKPWARWLSWNDFREYVLPYRGSNEPLEDWRPELFDKYAPIVTEMADSTDAIEAAVLINRDIMTWFGFDPRFYYHPTDQGLSEMQVNGLGRCEDMTNVTIFAMRANGIGVTSDYTPYWANTGNNHAWNAILKPGGEVIPFMGAEANPGEYRLANKFAKVYRKTFSEQPDNLAFVEHKQESLPRWLAGKYYRDVTDAYTETVDVPVTFDRAVPDSVDIAYLCVFNSGEWQPIQWSRVAGDTAVFVKMAPDIAYLPALYLNEEIVPYGAPFVLRSDGTQDLFVADPEKTAALSLISTTRRELVASTDGVAVSYLKDGAKYVLQYWADGWQTIDTLTAGPEPLLFENIPTGGLYWLTEVDSDNEERPFSYADGLQNWW